MVSDTAPTVADRLVDQWVENEHRAALTNRERVHAVQQMALEGLTVGQIAKRTATAKSAVEAATKIAASQAATEAVDQLTWSRPPCWPSSIPTTWPCLRCSAAPPAATASTTPPNGSATTGPNGPHWPPPPTASVN